MTLRAGDRLRSGRTRLGETRVRLGGIVTHAQHPPIANGTVFAVCEDETGTTNLIFAPAVCDRIHRTILDIPAVLIDSHIDLTQARRGS